MSRRTLDSLDEVSLHHLLKFLTAMEFGGNQKLAAQELGLTAPGLNTALEYFEERCGVELFAAGGKPTPAARAIVPVVRQIVRLAGSVERIANPGKIRIGITRTLGGALATIHAALKKRFPKLEFSYSIETSDVVMRDVAEGLSDVGIIIQEALDNYPSRGLVPEPAATTGSFFSPCGLFLKKHHKLARSLEESPAGLEAESFAWFEQRLSPRTHLQLDLALRAVGVRTGFTIRFTSSQLETLYGLLVCEDAVTIMPKSFGNLTLADIVQVTPRGWQLPEWEFAVIRSRTAIQGIVRDVWDETLRLCQSMSPQPKVFPKRLEMDRKRSKAKNSRETAPA